MLDFINISLDMKKDIDKYYLAYGEGSCQHSFISNFCLKSKYNDMFCEQDDILYIKRLGLCTDIYDVFLFPMCDKSNINNVKLAILNVIDTTHKNGKKVRFETITDTSYNFLSKYFDNLFKFTDCRNYYEYIYSIDKISELKGSLYQSKRNSINKLFKQYGDKLVVKKIENIDLDFIKKFYYEWTNKKESKDDDYNNDDEKEAFNLILQNYFIFDLVGIVVYIDDNVIGFNIGSKISNYTYDGMIQKGNDKYDGIYPLLNKETAKEYINEFRYLNFEEDLGIDGLRNSKLMYHPDNLIKKYIATEA